MLVSLLFFIPRRKTTDMATATRAKKATQFPNIFYLIGCSSELSTSELPILRDCFKYGLLFEERSTPKMEVRDRFKEVAKKSNLCLEISKSVVAIAKLQVCLRLIGKPVERVARKKQVISKLS